MPPLLPKRMYCPRIEEVNFFFSNHSSSSWEIRQAAGMCAEVATSEPHGSAHRPTSGLSLNFKRIFIIKLMNASVTICSVYNWVNWRQRNNSVGVNHSSEDMQSIVCAACVYLRSAHWRNAQRNEAARDGISQKSLDS